MTAPPRRHVREILILITIWTIVVLATASADRENYKTNHLAFGSAKSKNHIHVADSTKDSSLAKDFPGADSLTHVFSLVAFECKGKSPGYYADHQFHCEIFHFCNEDGVRSTYTCPFRSRFNQQNGACEDENAVRCATDDVPAEAVTLAEVPEGGQILRKPGAEAKGRVRRHTVFQTVPQQRPQLVTTNNVLLPVVPQNSNGGFVQLLVPQQTSQQQQQLFQLDLAEAAQFVPINEAQPTQTVPVQAAPLNLRPSAVTTFDAAAATPVRPVFVGANGDHLQSSSTIVRQGQVAIPRPQPSGSGFTTARRQPHSSVGSSFVDQQQLQSGSVSVIQQRPQSNSNSFVGVVRPQLTDQFAAPQQQHQQRLAAPPTALFASNRAPQPPRGFSPQLPPSRFEADFFHDSPQDQVTFFEPGPPQPGRAQTFHPNNGQPSFVGDSEPARPSGGNSPLFFRRPTFDSGPTFEEEEEFFEPDFPQVPAVHRRPEPQANRQGPPRDRPQQTGSNFPQRPSDITFVNEIRFPGPPQASQGQTVPSTNVGGNRLTQTSQPDPTVRRPFQQPQPQLQHQQQPRLQHQQPPQQQQQQPHLQHQQPLQQQRPQRPQPQQIEPSTSHHRLPNRFPPAAQQDFQFQPPQFSNIPQFFFQSLPREPQPQARPFENEERIPTRTQASQFGGPSQQAQPQLVSVGTPSLISGDRRPSTNQQPPRFHPNDRPFFAGPPARPAATPSDQAPHPVTPTQAGRGHIRFRPQEGDFSEVDAVDDDTGAVPQVPVSASRPQISSGAPQQPTVVAQDSAEAFGDPLLTDDFGSKLEPGGSSETSRPQFQGATRRPPAAPRPVPQTQRPIPPTQQHQRPVEPQFHQQAHPQLFPAPPSRPPPSSTPSSVFTLRPVPERLPPAPAPAPTRQPSFRPIQSESSTEDSRGGPQVIRGRPSDFFTSPDPVFPGSFDTSSEVPDQTFDPFFSNQAAHFGGPELNDGRFRDPFQYQTEAPGIHRGSSERPTSPTPSAHSSDESGRFGRPPVQGPTAFGPTFSTQSVDQLAPPELPPFTARPDVAKPVPASFDETKSAPRGHPQKHRPVTEESPTLAPSPQDVAPPPEATVASSVETITRGTKRGRRPVAVTVTGQKGVRTRPSRVRGRTRRPTTTTTKVAPEIAIESTTTEKPRRRIRPSSGTRRRRPVLQRVTTKSSTAVTGTLTTAEDPRVSATRSGPSTASAKPRRRQPQQHQQQQQSSQPQQSVVRRVQGRRGNVTRSMIVRRRPATTTQSTTDFGGTVDHSASHPRATLLSSDSTHQKVSVVSKLDAPTHDTAVSASEEQFTVTKTDDIASLSETASIQEHNSVVSPAEVVAERDHNSDTITRTTASSTSVVTEVTHAVPKQTTTITTPVTTWTTPKITEAPTTTTTTTSTLPPTTTTEAATTTSTQPFNIKPDALNKLRLLLNRKFVIKLTTETPGSS